MLSVRTAFGSKLCEERVEALDPGRAAPVQLAHDDRAAAAIHGRCPGRDSRRRN